MYNKLYTACFPKSLALTALLMNDSDEAKPCHAAGVYVPPMPQLQK